MDDSPRPWTDSPRRARQISPLLAFPTLLVALVAGLWTGVGGARFAITSSTLITPTVLEPGILYDLAVGALILDISNSDLVAGLNEGPLHIGQEDVSRVLRTTYDTTDTTAKGKEVHAGLIHFILSHPEREIFRISIARERPALADSLGRILLDRYANLPECGVGEDLGTLASAARLRLFGGSGEDFFNEQHPDCRPPDVVAEPVEEGLRAEIAGMSASGPDSLETFPEEEGDEEFAALMHRVQRGLLWTHPGWPILLLLGSMGVYALLHPRRRIDPPAAWFGVGLVVYGVLALALAPDRIRAAFQGAGTEGEASEIWGQLGSYALQRTALVSGQWATLGGLLLIVGIVIAGLMWQQVDRGRGP
jgi:hypothetical protein